MDKVDILGIKVDNLTMDEALQRVDEIIQSDGTGFAGLLNVSKLVLCKENPRISDYYNNCLDLSLVDGTNVTRLANLLHNPVKEKIYGNDFIIAVCKRAAEKGYSVFFLGGAPGAAEAASCRLLRISPALKIAGTYAPPYGFENDEEELKKTIQILQQAKADIVFVGLGSPKQDDFIMNYKDAYGAPLSIMIGSGIDITGDVYKRAPRWVSEIGFEWLYRCFLEPKRLFKRYIVSGVMISKYYLEYKRRQGSGCSGG